MEQVVLVIHLMLALGIIVLVLLQRSEGGGLGIGQGGGLGGLASAGSTANALTRVTGIFAFCFFGTSLVLGILAGTHGQARSLLDQIDVPMEASVPLETDLEGEAVEESSVPLEEETGVPTAPPVEEPAVPVE